VSKHLQEAKTKRAEREARRGEKKGVLGKIVSGRRVIDTGRPNYDYITLDDGTIHEAINLRVPHLGGNEVRIVVKPNQQGVYEVQGLDTGRAIATLGAAAGTAQTGKHSHNIPNSGLYDPVSTRRLLDGLVYHRSGDPDLVVYVNAFSYDYAGQKRYWPGGIKNLQAYCPVTGSRQGFAKIGIDPVTNSIVVVQGGEYVLTQTIGQTELAQIPFTNYIPLCGVRLLDTQAAPGPSDFLDCRPWTTGVRLIRKHWEVNSAAAAFQAMGIAAVTTAGTLSNSNQTDSTYVDCLSGGSSGNNAGLVSASFDLVRRSHQPVWMAQIRTGSNLAALRIWAGLFSAAPTNVDSLAGGDAAAFRYSTVASDTGWVGVVRDGTTQAVTGKIADIATSSACLLSIRIDDTNGQVIFSVNGGQEVAASANIPLAVTDLGFAIYVFTTEAVAKSIKISRVYCEHN
jgi:hypothetical protein